MASSSSLFPLLPLHVSDTIPDTKSLLSIMKSSIPGKGLGLLVRRLLSSDNSKDHAPLYPVRF